MTVAAAVVAADGAPVAGFVGVSAAASAPVEVAADHISAFFGSFELVSTTLVS